MLAPIAAAFSFLTRVPTGSAGHAPQALARSAPWFPLVGLVIGAAVGGVRAGVGALGPDQPLVAAAVAVTVGLLLTGGFHEDGLADMADGFGGGWSPEERLAIMKDSRHGTYGVLALVASVTVRVAAVAAIGTGTGAGRGVWDVVVVVAVCHLLARNWAVVVLVLARPARSTGGLSSSLSPGRRSTLLGAAGWLVVAAVAVGPVDWLVAAGAGGVATALVTVLAYRKVGGVTGDVLGAIEQVAECAALVAAALAT